LIMSEQHRKFVLEGMKFGFVANLPKNKMKPPNYGVV
jgi:hypothetical protein